MRKEGFERPYQFRRVGQVCIKRLLIVLPKDSTVWFLEKDVVAGIASLKLAYHFGRQVIILIFRLPIAVRQAEVVHQDTVNDNPPVSNRTVIECSGTKRPIKLPCTTLEQGLERRSHRPLMRYPKPIKLIQRIVIIFDDFVCWFEIEACHKTPSYK